MARPQALPDELPRARTNGLAVASLILGLLWIYWIGSVLAIILGTMAKNQIDESGGMQAGRGLAIAGIALGWLGVVGLSAIAIGLYVSGSLGSG